MLEGWCATKPDFDLSGTYRLGSKEHGFCKNHSTRGQTMSNTDVQTCKPCLCMECMFNHSSDAAVVLIVLHRQEALHAMSYTRNMHSIPPFSMSLRDVTVET